MWTFTKVRILECYWVAAVPRKMCFWKLDLYADFFYVKFGSIGQNMNLPSAKIWIICLLRFVWRKYSNSKSFLSRGGNLKQTQRYFSTEHRDNHNRVSNIPWININNKHNQTFSLQFMFKNYLSVKVKCPIFAIDYSTIIFVSVDKNQNKIFYMDCVSTFSLRGAAFNEACKTYTAL